MTSFRLKLTYYVLSVLITNDFVDCRPTNNSYNGENLVNLNKSTVSAEALNIPVETDYDTLVVAGGREKINVEDIISQNNENGQTVSRIEATDNKRVYVSNSTGIGGNDDPHLFFPEDRHYDGSDEIIRTEERKIENSMTEQDYHDPGMDEKDYATVKSKVFIEPVLPDLSKVNQSKPEQSKVVKSKVEHSKAEQIMQAEQNRDERMSKKTLTSTDAQLDLSGDDGEALQKQLNISSPFLDEIIDSETDRDESLTDIMFRPLSELTEDVPTFEFLIAPKTNVSESKVVLDKLQGVGNFGMTEGKNNTGDNKVEYIELVEVGGTKVVGNKSAYNVLNMTSHEVDNDAPESRFTDVQTLFLACAATFVPLLAILLVALCVRYVVRKCSSKPTSSSASSGSNDKQNSDDEEVNADGMQNGDVVSEADSGDSGPAVGPRGGEEPAAANGSIITMTLKNNHLIVETEERNDFTKNGRETKMMYSPESDGIFVVEVQQSANYRPQSAESSPNLDTHVSSTNQALIHRIPEESETNHLITKHLNHNIHEEIQLENKERQTTFSNTGLSISDLSVSSVGSHNVSYCYGSQIPYDQGPYGYPLYPGYEVPIDPPVDECMVHESSREPLISKTPTDPDKPVVTAAIFKQDSIIGNDLMQGPGYCIEGSSDGPLLSDVQAREVSLHQLHEKKEKSLENRDKNGDIGVSVGKKLVRADTLPTHLEQNIVPNTIMTIIEEDDIITKEALKTKRASLPSITTDVIETVKEAIKAKASPKFEKFNNDDVEIQHCLGPIITITEEIDTPITEQDEIES